MCGYDISWAAFNIIEVMSNSKFTHKVSTILHNIPQSSCIFLFVCVPVNEIFYFDSYSVLVT